MFSVLIVPDSFKGTLTAREVCDIIGEAFKNTIENVKITKLPAADGGEGLCACLSGILGGQTVWAQVSGVFGEKMQASYFLADDGTAVIEMAVCAGLPLAGENKNPEETTTFGVGELLLDAEKRGAKRILLGIGGSATNDCAAGMASALGWKFVDCRGNVFVPRGRDLNAVAKIIPPERSFSLPVTVACDVENPLYGASGAAFVFAPQKGADEEMVNRLDAALIHISNVINTELKKDVAFLKGAGAAGGMGAGCVAFLGAELKKGIDIVLDALEFDSKAKNCDLIVTGEGKLDFQSVSGKVVSGVAQRAKRQGKTVVAVCGCKGEGAEKILSCGISRLYFSLENEKNMSEIILTCRSDLYSAAEKAAKDFANFGVQNSIS